ncbi:NAD-dependent epimerase/dehydratase family protein [Methanoculleus sp. 10]|uniref:NAD-dependent epimerase/dehydratase family protein n=1 Tax=Methanoculleus sp. 10 TaxID=430615 RepID=UPI0025E59CED|nr:NAD-dependent epimerase/dehydratase family protein [Methanoculleus sp. 10]
MKALVTGCAGFIGSTLADRLLAEGYEVVGIDRFSDYYPREIKERNLSGAIGHPHFTLIEEEILQMEAFPGVDYVFHLAAQAGVRASWGKSFEVYTRDNVLATQHLLECYKNTGIKKFVYSSSSSVYGDVELPMREDRPVQPVSPYGVTKLAAEHLCYLYWKNYGVPTVSLRYFTVYGPRQRPDMGINKFVRAVLNDEVITVYGNGTQTRDFTYIDDVVEANVLAATSDVRGEVFNIGGGNRISVNDLIAAIEAATGRRAVVEHSAEQKGDVKDTRADTRKAAELLGWHARTGIAAGLEHYIDWIREQP